jgi:membrane associated rhomboid family serine protease
VFGSRSQIAHHAYVTQALIAVNTIMLLFSALSAGSAGFSKALFSGGLVGSSTPLMDQLALHGANLYNNGFIEKAGVSDGQYYRLITSMFMHYGLIHLFLNMLALYQLGRIVESALGPARFAAVYLLSGLCGSVAVYMFSPYGDTAGASGAVFGIFGALFVILKRLGQSTAAVVPIIVLNVIFTLTIPQISVAGHFGGLIGGALITAALAYAPRPNRTVLQVSACLGFFAILLVVTLARTASFS